MNLSKTRYCEGLQCKKMLWLYQNKPEEEEKINNERVKEQGNLVHEVARYLFPNHINIADNDNKQEMIKDTMYTIESYKDVVITEASFNYNNNFCSVDILKKNNDDYEMYEVKSSTELKDIYIDDASYQYYVLNNLGYKVNKCYLVHINNEYIRKESIDLEELFIKEDVTNEIISLQDKNKKHILDINSYMENQIELPKDIDLNCFTPYECPFFKYCTKNLPKNNVFNIVGMTKNKKIELYKKGKYSYEDLLKEDISIKYKKQIEYELYNIDDYINKKNIQEFLNTLSEPLYFLDFETFQMPIPLYKGLKPYEQIPFQYSLHILKNSELKHLEYLSLSGIDPRRGLALALVKDIPENVCVLAYNMAFEKTVIKKLAYTYPDLKEHLMNIYNNIKDLMIPFKNQDYYTKNMMGKYSIKYVLPALFPNDSTLNYHNLDLIHNGDEAMGAYANMENMTEEEKEYTKERLLRYCELDTYAMVKIYEKLKEVVSK